MLGGKHKDEHCALCLPQRDKEMLCMGEARTSN